MFAVVRTGGKQYKVESGALLDIERIEGDAGSDIELSDVLLVADGSNIKVGQPCVEGAKVTATIVEQKRGPKKIIFKKIRRHGKQLKKGHRQELTRIQIGEISA